MTNIQLLNRRHVLQTAIQHVQTSRFKYAITKNLKRCQSELEAYDDTLQGLIQEHEVELDAGQIPDDAPAGFTDEMNDLLQADAGEPNVHTIPDDIFDKEDDRGSDIPFDVLMALDFMIEE